MRPSGAITLAAILVGVAGCVDVGNDAPPPLQEPFVASGNEAWIAWGYALDGRDALPVFCVTLIDVDDEDNTGQMVFDLLPEEMDGRKWEWFFDEFAAEDGQAWQGGGIASDFDAHGSTGRGGTILPKVHVKNAGWGEVRVLVDGVNFKDPVGGSETWNARYEVLSTGVRDEKGVVWNAARSATYDPARPDDGYTDPRDEEIHFWMWSADRPPQAPVAFAPPREDASAPGYSKDIPLFDNPYFGTRANVEIVVDRAPTLSGTNLTFTLKGPSGRVIGTPYTTSNQTGPQVRWEIPFMMYQAGPYVLAVSSGGGLNANVQYTLTGTWTPPAENVLHFWWESLEYGDRAFVTYDDLRHKHPPPRV